MRDEETMQAFRHALRLAPTEATLYVHLCLSGPTKAGDLASSLRLHRNEVYRAAGRLLQRGLVEMTMQRPARYAAVSVERIFSEEIALRLASIDDLRTARDKVTALVQNARPPAVPEHRSIYKVVQGRTDIAAAQLHAIERARESILWVSTFAPTIRLGDATGALDALESRVRMGASARLLLRTTPAAWARVRPLLALPGLQARAIDLSGDIRFLVVDGQELLMWVVNDPTESQKAKDEVAIQTTAPGFVQAERAFFEQAWTRAAPPPD
jgi:sugar-specific transcriptional regulator TrmB